MIVHQKVLLVTAKPLHQTTKSQQVKCSCLCEIFGSKAYSWVTSGPHHHKPEPGSWKSAEGQNSKSRVKGGETSARATLSDRRPLTFPSVENRAHGRGKVFGAQISANPCHFPVLNHSASHCTISMSWTLPFGSVLDLARGVFHQTNARIMFSTHYFHGKDPYLCKRNIKVDSISAFDVLITRRPANGQCDEKGCQYIKRGGAMMGKTCKRKLTSYTRIHAHSRSNTTCECT